MKKKTIIAVSVLLFSTTLVHAQAALFAMLFGDKVASEKFNISLEVGGVFPAYTNIENDAALGINFGMAGNLKLSEHWYMSPNIYILARRNLTLDQFLLNSGNDVLDSQFMNVPTDIKLRYIDVPVLFYYETKNRKYRFGLGPQVSFLQNSEATFTNNQGEFTQDLDGYISDVDYGLMADFGYILGNAHKGKGIHIHLRYYYGFVDVLNDQLSTATNNSNYLSLHLSFPFITDELAEKNLKDD